MKQKLKTIIEELQNASKMHLRQSKELASHAKDMDKGSPANQKKLTGENKFGGTPDNTDKQAAYEKAQDQLFSEGKITETDDKAVKLIKKRVKKNAKKLSK